MPFILVIAILCFVFSLVLLLYYQSQKKEKIFLQYDGDILKQKKTVNKISFSQLDSFSVNLHPDLITSLEAHVKTIYLVHGTFVGEDPFHIIGLIDRILPLRFRQVSKSIRFVTKQGQDFFTRDKGNFTRKHINFLNSQLKNIKTHLFTWSSGNHHFARIIGMAQLVKDISLRHKKGDRILLIGHSHAGQVFALLTQFLKEDSFFKVLDEFFEPYLDLETLRKNRDFLRSCYIDIITMGAPPRYKWCKSNKIKIVHFINHRGEGELAGTFSGVLTTRDGDYIQQWGGSGSDFISPIEEEKIINLQLDFYFGKGSDTRLLREEIKKRKRLHNEGNHFLVDYGDQGNYGNFINTVFGHSVYTKISHLHFHLAKAATFLYK